MTRSEKTLEMLRKISTAHEESLKFGGSWQVVADSFREINQFISETDGRYQFLSPEDRIAARYRDLGVEEKEVKEEREAIKETELKPMLKEGVAFHHGTDILVPEYQARTEFDWKRAKVDGVLTEAHLKEYLETTVSEAIYFRKSDDSEEQLYMDYLDECKAIHESYKKRKEKFRQLKQNKVIR